VLTQSLSLFEERLAQIDAELDLLKGPNPTHPDYLAILECLDARRDEKIELENRLLHYRVKALTTRSKAERAQVHTQYLQTTRVLRETVLSQIFEESRQLRRGWEGVVPGKIQLVLHWKSSLLTNSQGLCYKFPTKRSEQILHQMAWNKEVSILAGVAKYHGFPAAPAPWTLKQNDVDTDLKAMGIK
jgi:hypothetical protein